MANEDLPEMQPSIQGTILDLNKIDSPTKMGFRLILCAYFLSVFELLKASIVEGVRNTIIKTADLSRADLKELNRREELINSLLVDAGIDPNPGLYSEITQQIQEYETLIGKPMKDRFRFGLKSSLEWLHERDVLTQDELDLLTLIKKHRNEVAHELPNLVVGKDFEVNIDFLEEMRRLLKKLDTYWFQLRVNEVEDTEQLLDGADVGDIDPYSLRMLVIDKLHSAVVWSASELDKELDDVENQ